ncbi:MAG TPA: hypothetical protein VM537_13725 [Anaerolineae bacterium]|nr:hypothetical protein [Anaerolineae bacterium]
MNDNTKKLIGTLIDIVHDIETEVIHAELLEECPPDPEDDLTCADCANCVKFGYNSYMCKEREGNESGQGESNVMEWDESCEHFKARVCLECGANVKVTERLGYLCGDCLDLRERLRMDAREDGGVVR